MNILHCNFDEHGTAVREIFNDAILNSTAIYEYAPRTLQTIQSWFADKLRDGFPVIGLQDEHKRLLGFATYGSFRAFPAYRYTVETSVYLHQQERGRGLGAILMREVIESARSRDMHTLVACIDMRNAESIRLHERLGFEQSGVIRQAGYKFGEWLDAGFFQLILDTPAHPV